MFRKNTIAKKGTTQYLRGFKLLAAVLLFGLAWSNGPAQANDCQYPAMVNAVCETIDECGNQACRHQPGGGVGNTFPTCTLYDLGGEECVQTGCMGSTCTFGD